ncbi:TRAP transporter substrate-binding protein [Maritimibacter fusiformis]|uniref:TRAP transporter substrate-binding protein n=1 Tax=Maritimibacter fusiformis TaxID=2603819 RepID=A0A5D0RIH5_9RHOB|nr:TRAP transporter substrate-binding protein [Maritimibacter fusiformis]TYB80478.1 TRAP transporter substrate-binding protein [Maritimibacter fusiformis]
MTKTHRIARLATAAALAAFTATGALAQEVTLKLHQFLSPQANVPKLILDVWADNVEAQSGGRIKVERYGAMALGGTPPELIDQAIDGIADVIWTAVGYTPGRFPTTEVFELPFIVEDARAASCAFWQMYDEHMKDGEFRDVKMIGTWVHGPGVLHTTDPVRVPGDLEGMKIRGGSRMVNAMLEQIGAEAVGMPVPALPEALSRGVVEGATLPWEVTGALKVPELVTNHTEFEGPALYNLTFILAMNKAAYDGLPDDLKAVIDANSGLAFSVFAGGTQADADAPARDMALDLGNTIVTIPADEARDWHALASPIRADWAAEMDAAGMDGAGLIAEAEARMATCAAEMATLDIYGR